MPKFTKGPWSIKSERWVIATRGDHEGEILVSPTYWMEQAKEEAVANARLISVAPEMYETLKLIVDVHDMKSELFTNDTDCAKNLADRARIMLEKAEGKS